MIKPTHLRKKDKVAIVALSLSAKTGVVHKAAKMIRQLDLSPVVYESCYLVNHSDPVPPKARAKDIMDAFCDESIKGVFCIRAGCGALEVLDYLDYDKIRRNPKVFMGFSDITGMHITEEKQAASFYRAGSRINAMLLFYTV